MAKQVKFNLRTPKAAESPTKPDKGNVKRFLNRSESTLPKEFNAELEAAERLYKKAEEMKGQRTALASIMLRMQPTLKAFLTLGGKHPVAVREKFPIIRVDNAKEAEPAPDPGRLQRIADGKATKADIESMTPAEKKAYELAQKAEAKPVKKGGRRKA